MESRKHKEMKYKIAGIARKYKYKAQVEMPSLYYMSFVTGKQKKHIDVWCEISRKESDTVYGRQIPIEIYYSEQIENIILDDIENRFWIEPGNSFRIVVSDSIKKEYTIKKEQSEKYFDVHLIPMNNLKGLVDCLLLGRKYLITNFKPKIDGIFTQVVGINYRDKVKIWKPWNEIEIGTELKLEREPQNNYDTNAIKILYDKNQLGYIPRDDAKELSLFIDEGQNYICTVESKFGSPGDNPILNIKLTKTINL